jgi:hypothetical protein
MIYLVHWDHNYPELNKLHSHRLRSQHLRPRLLKQSETMHPQDPLRHLNNRLAPAAELLLLPTLDHQMLRHSPLETILLAQKLEPMLQSRPPNKLRPSTPTATMANLLWPLLLIKVLQKLPDWPGKIQPLPIRVWPEPKMMQPTTQQELCKTLWMLVVTMM